MYNTNSHITNLELYLRVWLLRKIAIAHLHMYNTNSHITNLELYLRVGLSGTSNPISGLANQEKCHSRQRSTRYKYKKYKYKYKYKYKQYMHNLELYLRVGWSGKLPWPTTGYIVHCTCK